MKTVARERKPTHVSEKAGQWQAVYEDLKKGIISGKYRSGVRLVEDSVIETTGATRHAVRKAFDEIARLGLAIRYPNRGVQVRSFSRSEILDIYEVRECLELKAIGGYTEPAEKELVEKLKAIVARHEKAVADNKLAEMFNLNNLLHETIYQKCGNKFLIAAIQQHSLFSHLIHTNSIQSRELRGAGVDDHWAMIEAIEKGDQRQLARILRNHMRRFRDYYLHNLDE